MMTGTEMREILEALGMEQQALAKEIGKTPETISRWINDKRPIPKAISKLLRSMLATHRRKAGAQ